MTAEDARMSTLPLAPPAAAEAPPATAPRRGLFRKYVLFFVGLVAVALLVNGGFDFWFAYRESKEALIRVQQEKANAAADRIQEFAEGIERQLGWTTRAQWSSAPLDQRRYDYISLLGQVPALTEIAELDREGKEQLKVSRIAVDVVGSGRDMSQSPAFTETRDRNSWYSPVYFRSGSEPYLTLAMSRAGRNAGVTVAEVNLKLIWDVITGLKIGQGGYAYVVDSHGKLIAHQDIALVLRDSDFSRLSQVAAGLQPQAHPIASAAALAAWNSEGRPVLSAHAGIPSLGWLVFVEVPQREAFAPIYGLMVRSVLLLAGGFVTAGFAALFLARRMTVPIRALQEGAARIGAGDLERRLDIKTGDELESLAEQFNRMAADLQASYAELERKVEERTAELQESRARMADAIQSISDGLALWDRDDRLIMFNSRAEEILNLPATLELGLKFEDLIETLLRHDYYDVAVGDAEAWFEQRMALHHNPPALHEHKLADGTWLRIGEYRTQEGGTVTIWSDITTIRQREAEARASLDRLQQEFDAARELQLGMLPREFPALSPEQPVQVYATMEPAREVGGDLYDCFYASKHVFCFLVGDVSGKGAPAAMFMARTRSLVRMAVELSGDIAAGDTSPAAILEAVNRELCQNNAARMFVTLFFGVLDARDGTIAYINAGHPAPHLLRATGDIERLGGLPKVPLGVLRNSAYRPQRAKLLPGDAIVLCTDGVAEAMNADGELYTTERLETALRAVGTATPEQIVMNLKRRIDEFTGDAPKADDVTLFALRWHAPAD